MRRPPLDDNVERAHSFEVRFCEGPICGAHFIALREDDSIICEIVTSAEQTRMIIKRCQDFLYEKATQK